MSPDPPSDTSSSTPGPNPGGSQWRPPSLEEMQAMLPQYQFVALVGHGGMGAVYKAVQVSLDRPVAIKILPAALVDDRDVNFTERFKIEARTMARMMHPAIVSVFDFGETQTGLLYFVMEFIDGTDVSKMIESQKKLTPEHALAITAHVCDALQYAHTHGVIHRDIKPANILINMEGAVKVADFGLAKAAHIESTVATRTDFTMGTPDFVAPEALIAGTEVDGRADLYAAGVMLYNMLTGKIPRGFFQLPSEAAGCDRRFDAIVRKAMEQEPAKRYQTALEMRRDLDQILTVPVVKEKPQPAARPAAARAPVVRAPQPPAKKSSPLGPITVLLIILAAGGAYFLMRDTGGEKPTSKPPASSPAVTTPTADAPKPTPPANPTPAPAPAAPAVAATPPPTPATPATQPVAMPGTPPVAATPAPAPEPAPDTPVTRRLRELDEQFRAALDRDATKVRATAITDLDTKFIAALDRNYATATSAMKLDEAATYRAEKLRAAAHDPMPARDVATLPASLKAMRATYRTAFDKIDADARKTSLALHQKYEELLGTYRAELSAGGEPDEAVRVEKRARLVAAQREIIESMAPSDEQEFVTDSARRSWPGNEGGILVTSDKTKFSTPERFKPPVEITLVAKTNKTDLRMAYAADQVIFNWETRPSELRVDGGPAGGKHKLGAGTIPGDTFVTIRWVVTPSSQEIFVNDEPRYAHVGEYAQIDRPVSVFAYKSRVTVKSLRVRKIHPGPQPVEGEEIARISAAGTTLRPLKVGERAFSDRDYLWTSVPPFFAAHQFTQNKAQEPWIDLRVQTDGLVFLACTSRWAGSASGTPGDWQNEVTSRSQLEMDRWNLLDQSRDFKSGDEGYTWLTFFRRCTAGETFRIRTEKYASPFVIVPESGGPVTVAVPAVVPPGTPLPDTGGALSDDTTIRPGKYNDRKNITIGRPDPADPKKFSPVTITSGRGTEIFDSTIVIKKGTWRCDGSRFVRCGLGLWLGGGIEARNSIFEACGMSKSGTSYVPWWSSKWSFDNCIITQQAFKGWKLNDYGVRATGCTFYGVDFSRITYTADAADEVKKDWLVLKQCRFVECTVPESVLIATQDCVFENCEFGEADPAIPIQSPLAVRIYCTDPAAKPPAGPDRTITVLPADQAPSPAGTTLKHRRRGNIADFGPNGNAPD